MVSNGDIEALAEGIVARYTVERIILFGSHASGKRRFDSDVDLTVVMDYQGSGLRKSVEVLTALSYSFSCDLLVIGPDDLRRRSVQLDGLVGEAVDRGRVLNDRRNSKVA